MSLSLHDTLFCFSSRTSSSTAFFFLLLHDARSRKNQLKRLVPRVDRINEVSAKATDHRASNYTWMAMIKRVFDEAEEKRRRGEARRRWTGRDRWKGIFRVRFEITILSNSFLCVGSMDWWGRVTDDEIVYRWGYSFCFWMEQSYSMLRRFIVKLFFTNFMYWM